MKKSQEKREVKSNDIYLVIGHNIKAIQKRMGKTNVEFYDICFPGENQAEQTKSNKISRLTGGQEITLDKIIKIAANTGTPIAALFAETEQAYQENQQITEKNAGRVLAALLEFFNVAATDNPTQERFFIPEEELTQHYNFPPHIEGNREVRAHHEKPLYLRITPWYYSNFSTRVGLPVQGKRLFHFLRIMTKAVSPQSEYDKEERKDIIDSQLGRLSNEYLSLKPDIKIGDWKDIGAEDNPNDWKRK